MLTNLARFALLAMLMAACAGCGGGDPDDERASTEPVDCLAKPEACR